MCFALLSGHEYWTEAQVRRNADTEQTARARFLERRFRLLEKNHEWAGRDRALPTERSVARKLVAVGAS
jgi:hypothetical protein